MLLWHGAEHRQEMSWTQLVQQVTWIVFLLFSEQRAQSWDVLKSEALCSAKKDIPQSKPVIKSNNLLLLLEK